MKTVYSYITCFIADIVYVDRYVDLLILTYTTKVYLLLVANKVMPPPPRPCTHCTHKT